MWLSKQFNHLVKKKMCYINVLYRYLINIVLRPIGMIWYTRIQINKIIVFIIFNIIYKIFKNISDNKHIHIQY